MTRHLSISADEAADRLEIRELVRTALTQARSDGLSVLPFCPFVRAYIARHTEYLDLVPEDMRHKSDLPAHA